MSRSFTWLHVEPRHLATTSGWSATPDLVAMLISGCRRTTSVFERLATIKPMPAVCHRNARCFPTLCRVHSSSHLA